jgi:hypothetical protein
MVFDLTGEIGYDKPELVSDYESGEGGGEEVR